MIRRRTESRFCEVDEMNISTPKIEMASVTALKPYSGNARRMKGELVRCSVSRGVITAEDEQAGCSGRETAIGANAYAVASDAVRSLFGKTRKRADLDYDTTKKELSGSKAKAAVAPLLKPATAATAPLGFPARAAQPSKPAGFA